jgi:hypothetical protein
MNNSQPAFNTDERLYWIGINLAKGTGAVRFQALLDRLGDAKTARVASPEDLAQAVLGAKARERFLKLRASMDLEGYWDQICKQDLRVLKGQDEEYPPHLKQVAHLRQFRIEEVKLPGKIMDWSADRENFRRLDNSGVEGDGQAGGLGGTTFRIVK